MWGVSTRGAPGPCRGLQGPCRGLQGAPGPPGAFGGSRDLEGPQTPKNTVLNEKCGWLGYHGRGEGGGGGQVEACLQGRVEGVFKGI